MGNLCTGAAAADADDHVVGVSRNIRQDNSVAAGRRNSQGANPLEGPYVSTPAMTKDMWMRKVDEFWGREFFVILFFAFVTQFIAGS